jgi:hypothetical protein
VRETQTGQGGAYVFGQLCPGNYTVVVDASSLPEGVVPSPCIVGGNAAIDSNCSPASTVVTPQLPNVPDVDFGYPPVPFVYCESSTNSTGQPAGIDYDGNPSISENDFTLTVTGLPPNQPGYFFYGTQQMEIPFGNGVRCIGGSVTRYRKIAIEITGNAEVQLDFTIPPLTNIVPGIPYYFQLWYRDPAGSGQAFNTSDAICVIFAP